MGRSCSIQSLSSLSVLYTSATVNTGDPLAVVDVERNASDVEKVRALLAEYKVRIFAEVDTPSGATSVGLVVARRVRLTWSVPVRVPTRFDPFGNPPEWVEADPEVAGQWDSRCWRDHP